MAVKEERESILGQELEIFGISLKFYRRGTEAENHRHRHKKKHLHKYGYGEADAHPIEWAHFEPPDSFVQEGLLRLRACVSFCDPHTRHG